MFCLYKKEAERVEQTLLRKGWKCVSLHGDKSQAERTKAFNAFRCECVRVRVRVRACL